MTEYSKYKLVYRLQKWMDSVPGQTFLNYAYSWGASIVILGTLFKLTHLPAANIMLYIGMGTEVCVFFISAFDRPFDKTSIGKDLPSHVTEEYLEGEDEPIENASADVQKNIAAARGTNVVGGGTIIFGGNGNSVPQREERPTAAAPGTEQPAAEMVQQPSWIGQQQQVSPDMAEATGNYVEELKKLTDMLAKVSEQSARLTTDSEEMENLNRTLTGICKVYEMQLKGASAQIGTIDQINDQSRKMANQIEQLNKIYARMIEAMTVNMRTAASGTGNIDGNV